MGQRSKEHLLRKTGKRFRRKESAWALRETWESGREKDSPGASRVKRGGLPLAGLTHPPLGSMWGIQVVTFLIGAEGTGKWRTQAI